MAGIGYLKLLLLLCITMKVARVSAQGCYHGDIRLEPANRAHSSKVAIGGTLQFCYGREWRYICRHNDWSDNVEAMVACRQLGYSSTGATAAYECEEPNDNYVRGVACMGLETKLTGCAYVPGNRCNQNCEDSDPMVKLATVECLKANCTNGELRLVDGLINREGRVEVCVDGRWGTVCGEDWTEEEARLVCQRLGFSDKAPEVQLLKPSTENQFNCTRSEDRNHLNCTPVQTCRMEFGVSCLRQEQVKQIVSEECIEATTTCTQVPTTTTPSGTGSTDSQSGSAAGTTCDTTLPAALGVVIGLLVALLVAVVLAWIISAVCTSKHLKGNTTKEPPANDLTTTDHEMANPVYDMHTEPRYSSNGPTYEVVYTNEGATATNSSLESSARYVDSAETKELAEDHVYHVLEAGPGEGMEVGGCDGEGACDYEVPLSALSQ